MEYRFAAKENYEDFASGRVLYHVSGEAAFPVRLASELYERCLHYSQKKTDITLYDCCCGGAYMLTVLGFLKGSTIGRLYGSDIDEDKLKLAGDNLKLLTGDGIRRRRDELRRLYDAYGKESHREALKSIDRIEKLLPERIETHAFKRNALIPGELPFIPDIVLTDVPYGNLTEWSEDGRGVTDMMNALSAICSRNTIICVCMDKKQKIHTEIYNRLEKHTIGKRKYEIYRKRIYGTLACAKEYEAEGRLEDWVQLFLRGDGKNIVLADGLKNNNFRYLKIVPLDIDKLDVPAGIPDYLKTSSEKEWFTYLVNEMACSITDGIDMPPIIVHYRNGAYHPYDGRHRIEAYRKLGMKQAEAVIVVNTEEDYRSFINSI